MSLQHNNYVDTVIHYLHYYRLEALKRWKNRYGLRATYGNLLKLCVETGHTECAQVICDILKRKGSYYVGMGEWRCIFC